jgi:Bacteriophage HK97-gp10, putative tail-component
MIDLQIGGGEDAVERLRSFPDRLEARLGAVMQTIGGALQDTVRANLGGRVLRSRSGKLQSSVVLDVETDAGGTTATSGVGHDIPYAAYQEYGFRGVETVRAHLRTVKQVFGRPIAAHQISVRSFSRRVDYPAHSYLRSALADVAPELLAGVEDAVAEASSA